MALSVPLNRNSSPSLSPLSPTVIHYRSNYRKFKVAQDYDRQSERHHRFQTQHTPSRIQSFRQHYHRSRLSKTIVQRRRRRQSTGLWEVHQSSNGRIYYYNVITDRSQWEKPSQEQLSYPIPSSFTKNSAYTCHHHSKSSSKNYNSFLVSKSYHSKTSNRSTTNFISISNDNSNSNRLQSSYSNKKSHIFYHRSINKIDRNKSRIIDIHRKHHYKRKRNHKEDKVSFKKLRKDKLKPNKLTLLTPTSPPPNEIVQLDHVDPLPTSNYSSTNVSMSYMNPRQQSNYEILSTSLHENLFKLLYKQRSIRIQINDDLSTLMIRSSTHLSSSAINTNRELEYLPSIILPIQNQTLRSTMINSNSDDIKQYYRSELVKHLLNWPTTKIERETRRLSNEQIRITACQLISLRTDVYKIRLHFERNRFQLLKYDHIIRAHEHTISKLQLNDSDST